MANVHSYRDGGLSAVPAKTALANHYPDYDAPVESIDVVRSERLNGGRLPALRIRGSSFTSACCYTVW